ncbi:recombinase family protein [Brasilonema sp. CT11]|nr:recombinase family protein [Brasilonema sp. CT11]
MTKVVIYCRVSTGRQERSGLGLEAQLESCRNLATKMNLTIINEYIEAVSGTINPMLRPKFAEAISTAQKHEAKILVAKLDRFSRNVFHISGYCGGHFMENNPPLLVAESPDMKQFEMHIKAALAQEERDMISKRTKDALAVKKSQGWVNGAAGRTANVERARVATKGAIEKAIELRAMGWGYSRVANTLNEMGYTTSRGGKWYAANVQDRLNSLM